MPKFIGLLAFFPKIEEADVNKIAALFSPRSDIKLVENRFGNELLYSQAIPSLPEDLKFKLAIAREGFRLHAESYYDSSSSTLYIPETLLGQLPNLPMIVRAAKDALQLADNASVILKNIDGGTKYLGTVARPEILLRNGQSNNLVNVRFRISRNVVTHIKKQLPLTNGKINVAVGTEISPGDVLGEGQTPIGFRIIHLTHELGVDSKKAAMALKRKIGQTIFEGELLAEGRNLFGLHKRLLLSPVDGVLDLYDGEKGDLRIKLIPKQVKLISGVYGIVDGIEEKSGTIIIRTLATIVYGVVGSGKERDGIIKIIGRAEDLISSRQITETTPGQILVGGAIVFPEALHKVVRLQVAGIITGGINAEDYRAVKGGAWDISHKDWSDVGLTVMVTEGFGAIPLGDDIFSLLKEHAGKVAILDGNLARLILPINDQSSMIEIRKMAVFATAFSGNNPESGTVELKIGSKVKVISASALGSEGNVEAIDRSETVLPSGIKTFMVTLSTKKQKLRIPLENLEVIV